MFRAALWQENKESMKRHGKPIISRPDTCRRILDVLEVCERVSRPRLAELTGLGAMTVHRAAELLLDRGDVLQTRGADPATGRMTIQLCPVFRVPVLLLDLTGRAMTASGTI